MRDRFDALARLAAPTIAESTISTSVGKLENAVGPSRIPRPESASCGAHAARVFPVRRNGTTDAELLYQPPGSAVFLFTKGRIP
jgi:hypothetical protein